MRLEILIPTATLNADGTVESLPKETIRNAESILTAHISLFTTGILRHTVEGYYKGNWTTYVSYVTYTLDSDRVLDHTLLHNLCVMLSQESIGVVRNNEFLTYS